MEEIDGIYRKKSYWYLTIYQELPQNESSFSISIEKKKKPSIKIGDSAILLYKYKFYGYGEVTEAPLDEKESSEITIYKYIVDNVKTIDEPNHVFDFAYSLPKVHKHYIEPQLHFNRQYGSLTKFEYQVIINHDFFISRTAFGRIFNALHIDHKKSFINYANEINSNLIMNEQKDYVGLFDMLKDYININIIQQTKMLKVIDDILKNDLKINEDVGFVDESPNRRKVFLISKQVETINESESRLFDGMNLESISNGIRDYSDDEYTKNIHFKDKCLPLNFKN